MGRLKLMGRTDLVFRSIGERTAELALELAIERIRPDRVTVIEGLRPFSAAVERQLRIDHAADQVVYVDADCLILDDLVPFLDVNTRPYVDCFVTDRFRGRIHCGVHITSTEVVRAMKAIAPSPGDQRYVLRPESRLRNQALRALARHKEFRNFNILHDHFQFYRDVFYKYALRELRSRTEYQRARLAEAMAFWCDARFDEDIRVARMAVEHARRAVPPDASAQEIGEYIERLPETARGQLAEAGIAEKGPMTRAELKSWLAHVPRERYGIDERPRVFGIGLSRTGTRSLSMALHILGWDTVHYPADAATFDELARGDYGFSILKEYHGITDITVAPFYAQIDRRFPGSKFVLTVRDVGSWLRSCENHWLDRPAFGNDGTPEQATYMNVRRLLRAAVYGCYGFEAERFTFVYEQHVRSVREYFRDRPSDFLELSVCNGAGWGPLAEFLGCEVPAQPFPHKGAKLSKRLANGARRAADTTGSNATAPGAPTATPDPGIEPHRPEIGTRNA
jgi:hypothetical protein